jgi:hypothetical protein
MSEEKRSVGTVHETYMRRVETSSPPKMRSQKEDFNFVRIHTFYAWV